MRDFLLGASVVLFGIALIISAVRSPKTNAAAVSSDAAERFELLGGNTIAVLRVWRDRQTGKCYLVSSQGGLVEIEPPKPPTP